MSEECPHDNCDRTFGNKRGVRSHIGQVHNNPKKWQDKDVLKELYKQQQLSQETIAGHLGTSQETVSNWLEIHGIETRADENKPPYYTMQNDGYEM